MFAMPLGVAIPGLICNLICYLLRWNGKRRDAGFVCLRSRSRTIQYETFDVKQLGGRCLMLADLLGEVG